jgi:N-ethylmaleimide reductase
MSVAATLIAEAARPQQAPAELLFQPYKLGAVTLPHRIVMAPLPRSRARQPGNVPTPPNPLRTTRIRCADHQ